ncbi:PTS glucitol/sorbitol transporter subunit IIA [Gemelliphila palaticanis]|uniref:PTS glucitol/sorbitol transporter subunit IIA n=1 Tax=Gemelliphila palaticanis TaxID=81950 RepID=A0ABX2SYW9_9BACL|nr:PTS glucitol/sorbitol transporter subunit IIA [Gemella palaticanis]MBF0715583.1 PTS glucitol/sorbitol transporter subunit IIA [Gemella palaticanis]NYS47513.1 PTS glucitol/sorbitol transporter subunit IIA [Gemella palaticanis]
MVIIYENVVKDKGSLVSEFGNSMLITFGDDAPDSLKDYCYSIDIKNTNNSIESGQFLYIDNEKFEILLVGNIAERNLTTLGHVTINFTGESEVLPGAIVVENKPCPKIELGTVIRIES